MGLGSLQSRALVYVQRLESEFMILRRKAYSIGAVSKAWSDRYSYSVSWADDWRWSRDWASYSVSWADDWRWSRDWANGWFLNTLQAYYRQSKGGLGDRMETY